jgi:hypothetical protein
LYTHDGISCVQFSEGGIATNAISNEVDDMRTSGKQGVRAKRYLTAQGLAELFEIDSRSVPVWWKAGKLPPPIDGFGLKPRWSREAVVKWAEERGGSTERLGPRRAGRGK